MAGQSCSAAGARTMEGRVGWELRGQAASGQCRQARPTAGLCGEAKGRSWTGRGCCVHSTLTPLARLCRTAGGNLQSTRLAGQAPAACLNPLWLGDVCTMMASGIYCTLL